MNLAELIKVFQSDWKTQNKFLDTIPENAYVVGFSRHNRIEGIIDLYLESMTPSDDAGGFEGVQEWLVRTGISQGLYEIPKILFWEQLSDLATILYLIKESPRDILFTKQGLRGSQDWELVRKTAKQISHADFILPESLTGFNNLKARLTAK